MEEKNKVHTAEMTTFESDVTEVFISSLESADVGVGGIKTVMQGLPQALAAKENINVSIITPYYDVYDSAYDKSDIKQITSLSHIYNGVVHKSDIFRVDKGVYNGKPLYHYLIKPCDNSPVARIFEIQTADKLYQSFQHSEAQNRIAYFNSALAAMVRLSDDKIPECDILHSQTWHTGIAGSIIKEMENLPLYKDLMHQCKHIKKIPYFILTIHMLLRGEHGLLSSEKSVADFLKSIGLPPDFMKNFPQHKDDIKEDHLKQFVFTASYADMLTTVSKGLVNEIKQHNAQGLENIFDYIVAQDRLYGITNGINTKNLQPNVENLGEFAFDLNDVSASKYKLKQHLANSYPNLDPHKQWFIFIGRFANEKGVDYLPDLLAAVKAVGGNLIVLGSHVVIPATRYKQEIDLLKNDPDTIVLDNKADQAKYRKKLFAAADIVVNLSKNEACGLTNMETQTAGGSIAIAPSIQGLVDTVIPLQTDKNGTGFLYAPDLEKRKENLTQTVKIAADFLHQKEQDGTLNAFLSNLLEMAKNYDWNAKPSEEYKNLYERVMQRPLLTFDKIRSVEKPLLAKPAPILPLFQAKRLENSLAVKHYRGKQLSDYLTKTGQTLEDFAIEHNLKLHELIKVIQIGPNKTGSTAWYKYLLANNKESLHYGPNGDISVQIQKNYLENKPLLPEKYKNYVGYFDLENIYAESQPIYIYKLFKELDQDLSKQYICKFILTTRDKQNWLDSRCNHKDPMNGLAYVDVLSAKLNISREELREMWSKEWDEHHAAVTEYFKDRPQDLLSFDIETDDAAKITDFFKDHFKLDPSKFKAENVTPKAPANVVSQVRPKAMMH